MTNNMADKWVVPGPAPRLPIIDDAGNIRQVKAPLVVDRKEGDELIYQEEKKKRVAKKEARAEAMSNVKTAYKKRVEEAPEKEIVTLEGQLAPDAPEEDISKMTSAEKTEKLAETATRIIENPEKNVCFLSNLF
jgi:hypothetical protein